MSYEIEYYGVSHAGKCRQVNQDNLFCSGRYLEAENNGTMGILCGTLQVGTGQLFGIFDGMGGEECGEAAAYLAAREASKIKFEEEPEKALLTFCQKANRKICRYTKKQGLSSMGTTAAILLFGKKQITLCNVGDSKIFRFSKRDLQQISYDHVSIAPFGQKPPLTQSLGIPEEELTISPYFAAGKYQKGDVYLICSDGLTDMVTNEEIAQIIRNANRETAAELLLQKALDNGGKDNVSFILLYINKKMSLLNFGRRKKHDSR